MPVFTFVLLAGTNYSSCYARPRPQKLLLKEIRRIGEAAMRPRALLQLPEWWWMEKCKPDRLDHFNYNWRYRHRARAAPWYYAGLGLLRGRWFWSPKARPTAHYHVCRIRTQHHRGDERANLLQGWRSPGHTHGSAAANVCAHGDAHAAHGFHPQLCSSNGPTPGSADVWFCLITADETMASNLTTWSWYGHRMWNSRLCRSWDLKKLFQVHGLTELRNSCQDRSRPDSFQSSFLVDSLNPF